MPEKETKAASSLVLGIEELRGSSCGLAGTVLLFSSPETSCISANLKPELFFKTVDSTGWKPLVWDLGNRVYRKKKKSFFRYKILNSMHWSERLNDSFKTGSPLNMVNLLMLP